MFKVGDKVVVVNNKNVGNAFSVGEKFTIEFEYTTENKRQRVVLLEKGSFFYDSKFFKLDEIHYRKEKILKIKERMFCNSNNL